MSSGASSAFLNGAISDRTRQLIRRKDLDIHEILDICSEPIDIEDRVTLVREMAKSYPELRLFLLVAYFYPNAFTQINTAPLDFIPSRVGAGASQETMKSMWNEITKIYDSFPTGPRVKRGRAQGLLGNLYIKDALIIKSLFEGKFYRTEVNEVVVAKAFPKDVPQSPKD